MPRRTGRDAASILTESMNLRLHKTERSAFGTAAKIAGLTVGQWMRERLRRAARAELEDAKRDVPFMAK